MAAPEYVKLKIAAGMFPDEAPGEAEAHWKDGSWVRFVVTDDQKNPALEVMGGWEKASLDTFDGKIRKIVQYGTNLGYPIAALGGSTSTWALFDTELYFTTPIVTYGVLANPFSTTIGDASVTVAHTAHGRASGDFVNFPESPVVTGSGITLYSGHYAVTVIDANSYTVEAVDADGVTDPASATVSGVGGNVDYEYFLAGGNEYGLGGAGYGTGAYDVGTYGGVSSVTAIAPRTWTMAAYGQNIIAAPRGGGIYEGSPYFSTSELAERITNGSFTGSASGWTLGAGWAYAANAAAATLSNAALSQSITVVAGTWNLLKFDLTRSAGTLAITVDGVALGTLNATGRYFVRFWGGDGGAQTVAFTGAGFTGTIDTVSAKVLGTLAPLLNAPTVCTGVMVTPYLHVLAWGVVPDGLTDVDPMCIKTSTAEDPQNWTVSLATEAREYFLGIGTRIIVVLNGDNNQMFAITDAALFVATYTASPTIVWRFDERGLDCGCMGINSACVAAGTLYWMGNNHTFYMFDGSATRPLTCPGIRYVFDNIQVQQQDLVQCWHNAEFKEVWWCWPDKRDSNTTEISRYATFNYRTGKWSFGSRVRTAWGSAGPFGYPLAAATDGYLYFHEISHSADGGPLDFDAETGAFDIGDGNTLHEISGYISDSQNQEGSFQIEFLGYEANQNSPEETSGAITISPSATYSNSFFVQGRQSVMRLSGNDAPMRLRLGNPRILLQDTGNQF